MCDSSRVNSRALLAVILGATLLATLVFVVVIPGVERGGWAEVLAVFAVIGAFAVADRWLRRFARRRR